MVRTTADIVRCPYCQLVFLRTRPLDCELWRLYQKYADDESHMRLPKSVEEQKSSGLRRQNFVDFVSQTGVFMKDDIKVLDVGCGWGALLDCMKDNYRVTGTGFEICEKAATYCNDNITKCYSQGQFYDPGAVGDASNLDLITMCHVLEHMVNLKAAMACIVEKLKQGGVFAGIVPNFNGRGSYHYKEDWYWLDANFHYIHFTTETLTDVLGGFGFEGIVIETHRGDFEQERLRKCYQWLAQRELNDTELAAMIAKEDQNLRGEEIWFQAVKK